MLRAAILCHLAIENGIWSRDQAAAFHTSFQALHVVGVAFEQWAEGKGALTPAQTADLMAALRAQEFQCMQCTNLVRGDQLVGDEQLRCPYCDSPAFTRRRDRIATTQRLDARPHRTPRLPPPDNASANGPNSTPPATPSAVRRAAPSVPPFAVPVESEPKPAFETKPNSSASASADEMRLRREAERPALPTIGNWQLLEMAGQGGSGTVYRSYNRVLDRYAAIKVLEHSFEGTPRRFQLEARVYAALDHPNIVKVFDFGENDGKPYIIMEWIEGRSLAEAVEDDGPMAVDDVMPMAVQICEGLFAAHQAGIIHRDIKPDNIMLTADGQVKITDFGLAKFDKSHIRLTSTGVILGTPIYMAPEQILQQPITPRTDIYALGVTLHFALCGHDAFSGSSHFEIMNRHLTEELPSLMYLPDMPPELDRLIGAMCRKKPEDRPASAKEISRGIRRIFLGESGGSHDAVSLPTLAPIFQCEISGKFAANEWLVLADTITAAQGEGFSRFVFEMAKCQAINSTGLGVLVRVHDAVTDAGGTLILASLPSRVKIVFEMMGVACHFFLAETLEKAVELLGNGPVTCRPLAPPNG